MVFIYGIGVFSFGNSFICSVGIFYRREADVVRERIYSRFSYGTDVFSTKSYTRFQRSIMQ